MIYKTIKERKYLFEVGNYITYGIVAQDEKQYVKVSDVFLNKKDADKFVSICNNNSLSLIHLYDVIEDYMWIIVTILHYNTIKSKNQ